MTSLSWKRSLLSISALFLFAYLVSSAPFFSNNLQEPEQQQQQQQQQQSRQRPKVSKMTAHPSKDLDVTISPASSSTDNKIQLQKSSSSSKYSLPLHVSITNTADHPISFLKWNSPLDSKASLLGVFHVSSTSSGEDVPLDTIKFNRKLPPPIEDVVEIQAGEKVERDVEVSGVSLEGDGGGYKVRAEGRWQGIWRGGLDEVAAEGTLDGVKPSGNAGQFKSNELDVSVQ